MKRISTLVLLLVCSTLYAQTSVDLAVQIEATVQKSPAQIKLNWETTTGTGQVSVYRKAKNSTSWGNPIATLPSTTTTYTDVNVSAGNGYEYCVLKKDPSNPIGYIYAGIEEPAIHKKGAILLLVDTLFSTSCNAEITTLMNDLRGDGWEVLRKDFPRTETVTNVKNHIKSTAQSNSNLSAIYILGHIAVPYSGDLNPDGHGNHKGAWPTDGFYGDIDGTWSDAIVSNTSSANSLNHNTPGDGKFDQSYFPSAIDLQVGRVDFYDMPAFGKTEVELMKSYLNRAHQYKAATLNVTKRGLIDDNFKNYAERFGSNAWRNYPVMVGIDSVFEKDFISTLNTDDYQWAFGCGGGTYTKCNGVGNTTDFVSKHVKSIFVVLFGSYFGDWNYKNNFLRAPMCAETPALGSFWAGRPNWHLHHMALGENIGYSVVLSQNNSTLYHTPISSMSKIVNIGYLGDPTLRTEYVLPATNIAVSKGASYGATISWTATTESAPAGYYVYRSSSEFGAYELRSDLVSTTSFTDSFGKDGTYWYMVRAAKVETTPSGTYYNLSVGEAVDAGNIIYPFDEVGINNITASLSELQLYPNPTVNAANIQIASNKTQEIDITVTNTSGKAVLRLHDKLMQGNNLKSINTSNLPAGMYMVYITTGQEKHVLKLAKTY